MILRRAFHAVSADATKLLAVCGPSGVGKGTIVGQLISEFPSQFSFATSHTTRSPRNKERDGAEYHFVGSEKFEKMVKRGEFLEHAHVHGHSYGTSVGELSRLARSGSACVLDIDIQGIQSLWEREDACFSGKLEPLWDELVCVAILPESLSVLEDRLRSRGSETSESLARRLSNALSEIEFCSANEERFDLTIVNSDSWEVGYPALRSFLLAS